MRTHTCNELRKENQGEHVILCGWLDSIRIQSKMAFIDLRDRYGTTQVFVPQNLLDSVRDLTKESVIKVPGVVKVKPKGNPKLDTGDIEVSAEKIELLNKASELPISLDEKIESTEENRMKYRYIDLRRPRMQNNLKLRHKVTKAARDFLDKEGFLEIETPFLAKSTPEGARDYLVPSRVNKKKFYALPQSPQLFKQLLMISGYDKYFQIVRCFRDEDLRSDRQPEFTQIDLEMSFVEQQDLIELNERLMKHLFKECLGVDVKIPFEKMTYREAFEKYKTDKPDLRKSPEEFKFLWVTDFPMFEFSDEDKKWKAAHHPFTMPTSTDFKNPKLVGSKAYDLVLNGWEVGGGSIRIHDPELQLSVLETLGLSKKEAEEKFGFLLSALKHGAPPHGGIAFGLDRLVALMAREESLRDVIPFPKNKDAQDTMLDAPSEVHADQLKELSIGHVHHEPV